MGSYADYADRFEADQLRWSNFDAVVIGVSAGGINALSVILPALPANYGLSVAIVQHLPADANVDLAGLFRPRCRLTVEEAGDKEVMSPGVVYFAPPGYHLLVERDKTFALSADEYVNWARPSADVLFESAADALGGKVVGVVLTGANNDGARGLHTISVAGGLTVVQDPASAEVNTMPQAALALTRVDYVLSLVGIAELLSHLHAAQEKRRDGKNSTSDR